MSLKYGDAESKKFSLNFYCTFILAQPPFMQIGENSWQGWLEDLKMFHNTNLKGKKIGFIIAI